MTVQHVVNSPKRITVDGGTWTTRVGPGVELAYVNIMDTAGFRMHGTRIRVEEAIAGSTRNGMRFRPANQDMADLHLDGVTIDAPDGLANGFVFGAINRNIANLALTGCTITGAATNAITFSAAGTNVADPFPILQGNDFARCGTLFVTDHAVVFPVIAGNRGGQCTMTGSVAPEGVVTARSGSRFLRQNGNTAELWWKASGTGATGWTKLA